MSRKINILLIEDNEGDVILTREALEHTPYVEELEVIKNGELAINHLNALANDRTHEFPDIVFLDINLPKKNGHEVLQFIKTHEVLKELPVIMLTTSSSDYDVSTAYRNHANCFIMKPVDIHSFIEVISKLIEFWGSIAKLPSHKKLKER